MNAAKALRNLQARQREHDIRAHQDIYYLSYPDRMKHLSFHVAKYAGRLAVRNISDAEFARTLVDAFIISLSAADVLRIDFSDALNNKVKIDQCPSLVDFGLALRDQDHKAEGLSDWYFRKIAYIAGRMAKACESLDHMEPIPYREVLSEAAIDLCQVTIIAAAIRSLDLLAATGERWEIIEAQRIF